MEDWSAEKGESDNGHEIAADEQQNTQESDITASSEDSMSLA
jgi:hypothetical protein